MIRWIAVFAILVICSMSAAFAQSSDWQDGVFTGPVIDLFHGQNPQIVAFVQAHDDLAEEARAYLSPCAGGDTDNLCDLNQTRFVLDYIAAYYGDHDSQWNVADFLSGDEMPPKLLNEGNMQIGVSPSPMLGCAWRIAILTSGSPDVDDGDLTEYKSDCEGLDDDVQSQANGMAVSSIVPRIHALMAKGTIPYELVDDYPGSP